MLDPVLALIDEDLLIAQAPCTFAHPGSLEPEWVWGRSCAKQDGKYRFTELLHGLHSDFT
jgi:hypothetical protein